MHNIAWWNVKYENDYLYDAISEWFVDEGIMNCNNLPGVLGVGNNNDGGGGGELDRIPSFADLVWTELIGGILGGNNNTISQATAQLLFKSLARINCEIRQSRGGRQSCKRPKCFDDCSNLIPCDYDYSVMKQDINITLNELLDKVRGYPCMVETRITYYSWAKENGDLLALCRGDYDNFCDVDSVIKSESALDACPVSESYATAVLEEYGNAQENTYAGHSDLFYKIFHDDDNKIDYTTLISISMVITIISLNIIGFFYLNKKKTPKFKYLDNNDDDDI